ncbi:ig family protein [Stylonychia lemnae]|uniref:Ig family protein n=1 Tax=Stylonychia lemnae TaxID=5949 RepID=A0A078AMU1_STYLE|nr:ig family protein [Stylonychia lemnae]|eukprot:CDW82692.1 ig family protein [Stylonychia lemnae]
MAGFTITGARKFIITFGYDQTVCTDIEASPSATESVFYTAGRTYSNNIRCRGLHQYWDQMIAKYSTSDGSQQWLYTIGGNNYDLLEDIVLNNDGTTLYGVGMSQSFTYGESDHVLMAMKTSGAGSLLFYKRYGCTRDDQLLGITISNTNQYIVFTGQTQCFQSSQQSDYNIPTFKYDLLTHQIEWMIVTGASSKEDYSNSIQYSLYDQGTYQTIQTLQGTDSYYSGGFMKISSDGQYIYAKKFAGTDSHDSCDDLDTNEDGRVVFLVCTVGSTSFISSARKAAFILKINGVDGTLIQARIFDSNRDDNYRSVAVDKYGFVTIAFSTDSTSGNWAISSTSWGVTTYYRSVGVLKIAAELDDVDFLVQKTTVSLTDITTDWNVQRIGDNIQFINQVMTGQVCSISSGNVGYSSQSWSKVAVASTVFNKLYPPLMNDLTFKVGQTVSVVLNNFCYDTVPTYVDVIGLDYNTISQTLYFLPPGLILNWVTQRLTGKPTQAGIYALKLYKAVSSDEVSTTILITITGGNSVQKTTKKFEIVPDTVIAGKQYYYSFDPTDYFNDDDTYTYQAQLITQRIGLSITYSDLPSWLTFNSQNYTFIGATQSSDYSQFPVELEIVIKASDGQVYHIKGYTRIPYQDLFLGNLPLSKVFMLTLKGQMDFRVLKSILT